MKPIRAFVIKHLVRPKATKFPPWQDAQGAGALGTEDTIVGYSAKNVREFYGLLKS
ncbi:MAG: hypothetical protein JSV01_04330 [Desulfobacterales bacterium]|nr:MAG: hypothetical protein JSV01_04330 [Desulfobacterales bacterium]